VKEYVAKLEMDLKDVSVNFVRSRKYDSPNRLRGRIWQDVLSPWWANPTITYMTEDEFRERFYHTVRPSLRSRVKGIHEIIENGGGSLNLGNFLGKLRCCQISL
jgi:hypothetical protein